MIVNGQILNLGFQALKNAWALAFETSAAQSVKDILMYARGLEDR